MFAIQTVDRQMTTKRNIRGKMRQKEKFADDKYNALEIYESHSWNWCCCMAIKNETKVGHSVYRFTHDIKVFFHEVLDCGKRIVAEKVNSTSFLLIISTRFIATEVIGARTKRESFQTIQ